MYFTKWLIFSWNTISYVANATHDCFAIIYYSKFAEFILEYFKDDTMNVVLGYANKIVNRGTVVNHSHEEADTLIPNQVLDVSKKTAPVGRVE